MGKAAAVAARRPPFNLIETAALASVREAQFVDDVEMAQIRQDENLLRRLAAGSEDARERRGRFVE